MTGVLTPTRQAPAVRGTVRVSGPPRLTRTAKRWETTATEVLGHARVPTLQAPGVRVLYSPRLTRVVGRWLRATEVLGHARVPTLQAPGVRVPHPPRLTRVVERWSLASEALEQALVPTLQAPGVRVPCSPRLTRAMGRRTREAATQKLPRELKTTTHRLAAERLTPTVS